MSMFCPNCGNRVLERESFCANCGTNLNEIKNQIQQYMYNQSHNNYQQPFNNQNKNSNKKTIVLVITTILILAVIVVLCVSILMNKNDSKNNNQTNNQEVNENTNSSSNTKNDYNSTFLMPIEDVFLISGAGTFVTGRIERGTISVGDEVQITGLNHKTISTTVNRIEMYKKSVDSAKAGDNVQIGLTNVSRTDIEVGQVLIKANSTIEASKFDAEIYFLTEEEGGRRAPFYSNYLPTFFFGPTEVMGKIVLLNGVEEVMPGDSVKVTVELRSAVAMEVGTDFTVREGGRIVGRGTVTKVY